MQKLYSNSFLVMSFVLLLMFGCTQYFLKDNPNVKTPLDASKVSAEAFSTWYVENYQLVLGLNKDPFLTPKSKDILRTKVNPIMDNFKIYLIEYLSVIERIENSSEITLIDKYSLAGYTNKLQNLKTVLIEFLLLIEQDQITKGGN